MSRLFDRRFEGNPAQYDFTGYSLVDAMLFYDAERMGRFTVAVSNILDKQYITYFSQTSNNVNDGNYVAGRGRAVTLRWQDSFCTQRCKIGRAPCRERVCQYGETSG